MNREKEASKGNQLEFTQISSKSNIPHSDDGRYFWKRVGFPEFLTEVPVTHVQINLTMEFPFYIILSSIRRLGKPTRRIIRKKINSRENCLLFRGQLHLNSWHTGSVTIIVSTIILNDDDNYNLLPFFIINHLQTALLSSSWSTLNIGECSVRHLKNTFMGYSWGEFYIFNIEEFCSRFLFSSLY